MGASARPGRRCRRHSRVAAAVAAAAAAVTVALSAAVLGAGAPSPTSATTRWGRRLAHAGHDHSPISGHPLSVKDLDPSVVGVMPGELPPPGEADDGAHAVPGDTGYTVIDLDGDGKEEVLLDGSASHTHNDGPGADEGYGGLVAVTWSTGDNDETIIGADIKVPYTFPLGTHTVKLTVKDHLGDIHAATTTVRVTDGAEPGVWCYFYEGETGLAPKGKPTYAAGFKSVSFQNRGSFGVPWGGGGWAARCIGAFNAGASGAVAFSFDSAGPVGLSVDGKNVALNGAAKGSVDLAAGAHSLEATYVAGAGEARLVMSTTPSIENLSYNAGSILPVLESLSSTGGGTDGGNTLSLSGSGFLPGEKVTVGGKVAEILDDINGVSSTDSVNVVVPEADGPGPADVVVTTVNGASNALTYTYTSESSSSPQDVVWATDTLKVPGGGNYGLGGGTTVAVGPDRRLYVGTAGGWIHRLDVNYITLTVTGSCDKKVGGQILGVSFNPRETDFAQPTMYISTGELKTGDWKAGRVLSVKSLGGGACFSAPKEVVTGLPVQARRDHSVGRPAWDQNGDMLLPVGGVTNAGVEAEKTGGLSESPLSGAIVRVPLSTKGGSFNGAITYSNNNPGSAVQTGGDVSVWASGLRNALFLERHSSGTYWIMDNGANAGFGDVSTGCGGGNNAPFGGNGDSNDKLLAVKGGGYYGHPNRNRGRAGGAAARECTYRKPGAQAPGYTPPVALFDSSTNGIAEMRANVFGGAIKGHLFFAKFASGGDGAVHTAVVSGGGSLVGGGNGVKLVKPYSGLSIAISPYGALLMPRVRQGKIVVLRPVYDTDPGRGVMVMSVTPNRGPRGGGYRVFVAAHNVPASPTVVVGGKACTGVKVESNGLTCNMPAGKGKVAVSVDGATGKGHDFEYLSV